MRASRAYIAGFGTSTVLVGSTLLLFLVVSALVAFRAWPGSGITDAVSDLVVKDPRPALTVDGPTQVALDAAPAAAAVGAAAVSVTAPDDGGVAAGGPISGTTGPGGADPRTNVGDGPGSQPPAAGAPTPQPAEPGGGVGQGENPVRNPGGVTNGLGDTTQGVTDGLGKSVGGVNPDLGKTVTDTGKALSDLVRGVGGK